MNIRLEDRYVLIRLIGEGGYGEVWLANDTINDMQVAIKFYKESFSEDLRDRAYQEYSIGRIFDHPNILPLYEFGCNDECIYFTMPYCCLGSIDQLKGKIDEKRIWKIIRDVCSGLVQFHNCGLLYLDLKPHNILQALQDHYVLSDFGLSHRVANIIHLHDKFRTIGGAAYVAPEGRVSGGEFGTFSDVWSLGVTIYELVTGELPFNGLGGDAQLSSNNYTINCKSCSARLSNLIDACINPYPEKRPTAMAIMALADAVIAGKSDMTLFNIG